MATTEPEQVNTVIKPAAIIVEQKAAEVFLASEETRCKQIYVSVVPNEEVQMIRNSRRVISALSRVTKLREEHYYTTRDRRGHLSR